MTSSGATLGKSLAIAALLALGLLVAGLWALAGSLGTAEEVPWSLPAGSLGPSDRSTPTTIGSNPSSAIELGLWAPISVVEVLDPRDYGAISGDGIDDSAALLQTIQAFEGDGGIIWFDADQYFDLAQPLELTRDHVKFWSPSGRGGINQLGNEPNRQAIWCVDTDGCGFFWLELRSNATRRLDSILDHQITLDGATNSEIVGNEISGSAATGVFVFGSSGGTKISGNYIHHTWADGIHFTDGSQGAHVWGNVYFNEPPSLGDDGIACVTYGDTRRCGEMEWWDNLVLGNGRGRGLAVVGGENLHIHNNFIEGTAAAGILVASESGFDTNSSKDVRIERNVLLGSSIIVGHPGILISGLNSGAGPLRDIDLNDNLVVNTVSGRAYGIEGDTNDISNGAMSTDAALLPQPLPSTDFSLDSRDAAILRTWDTSFVDPKYRPGLYRIHVRRGDLGGFEQRFEYVISAPTVQMDQWVEGLDPFGGGSLVTYRGNWGSEPEGGEEVVVLLSATPIEIGSLLEPVTFAQLRQADLNGSGTDLWRILD